MSNINDKDDDKWYLIDKFVDDMGMMICMSLKRSNSSNSLAGMFDNEE